MGIRNSLLHSNFEQLAKQNTVESYFRGKEFEKDLTFMWEICVLTFNQISVTPTKNEQQVT
jgi:hypothetical protein